MIILSIFSMFISCTMNSGFWNIINIDLKPHQSVETIVNIGDTIVLGGAIYQSGFTDVKTARPFLLLSFDKGKNWVEKNDFDFNEVKDVQYSDGILFITASKYTGESNLALGSRIVYYKYDYKGNYIIEIKLPDGKDGALVRIVDKNTFIFQEDKGYAHHNYLKTLDEGKTWEEHKLTFYNKSDIFNDMCLQGNKMWGVRTHNKLADNTEDKDFQSLISIDINTWQVIDEIPLGETSRDNKGHTLNTYAISDIKTDGETLYLLGHNQLKNTGYVWSMSGSDKKIKIHDSFELTDKQIPSRLFLYKNKILLTYTDVTTHLPTQTILYKDIGQDSWKKEQFPDLTYPFMSFSYGMLMGIAEGNKIYYRGF